MADKNNDTITEAVNAKYRAYAESKNSAEDKELVREKRMTEQEAFEIVFKKLAGPDSPNMFKGLYDAKNGSEVFMHGIGTVMEYVAYCVSEETADRFMETFIKNEIASEEKANCRQQLNQGEYL